MSLKRLWHRLRRHSWLRPEQCGVNSNKQMLGYRLGHHGGVTSETKAHTSARDQAHEITGVGASHRAGAPAGTSCRACAYGDRSNAHPVSSHLGRGRVERWRFCHGRLVEWRVQVTTQEFREFVAANHRFPKTRLKIVATTLSGQDETYLGAIRDEGMK
jgi:hypothetical protein